MTVYGEFLFLENFIIGYLILTLTCKLCARRVKRLRTAVGAFFCGIFSFLVFASLDGYQQFISRLLFSLFITFIVFGKAEIMIFMKRTAAFYCVTFALGGCCTAVIYMTQMSGFMSNKSVYIELPDAVCVLIGIAAGAIILYGVEEYLRSIISRDNEVMNVELVIGEKTTKLNGMVDTANFLSEPISGKPVSIVRSVAAQEIFPEGIPEDRMRIVPCERVGERKLLKAFRCDSIYTDREKFDGGYIAFYEGYFGSDADGKKLDILLQRNFLRGERIS